jgi:L,D-transpeptidase catalytic domain
VARLLTALVVAAILGLSATPGSARVSLANGSTNGWTLVRPAPVGHVIAYVKPGATVALRSRPFGSTLGRLGATTAFGSRRALSVVRRASGRWLAVTTPELGNKRLGWIDARGGNLRYRRTPLELVVDLSQRTLELRRGARVVRRVSVGIGRPDSPTPTGRFAVTDKLSGPAYSAFYGCCILALSATQPNLPAGWTGGNRIAIHGTPPSSDFGQAVSAGCMHAPDDALQYLMRTVPLGTPVVIHP